MEIKGQAAIVTGGASGLGAATVRAVAAAGGRVAILDRDEVAGRSLAEETGGSFQAVDVANDDAVAAAIDAAWAAVGPARLLVNCAGVVPVGRTVGADGAAMAIDVIHRNIEINLLGTLYALRHFSARLAAETLLGEERGLIVNTASIAAFEGQAGQVAYAASKGGIAGLTLPAARDLAPHAIRVVTVAPGMFRTAMVGMLSDEAKDRLGAQVPFPNRLGDAGEFAQFVLAIVANPMLNGAVLRLDGAHRLP